MKGKYIKYIILILVLVGIIIGLAMYKYPKKVFYGGSVSSCWVDDENYKGYSVNIDSKRGYSEEQIEFFTNIATKKRKEEIDIDEALNLGNPKNEMRVIVLEKSTGVAKWIYDFKLWLKEDVGYIQSDDEKYLMEIYKLDDEEHEFIVNALLKYHSGEEIFMK